MSVYGGDESVEIDEVDQVRRVAVGAADALPQMTDDIVIITIWPVARLRRMTLARAKDALPQMYTSTLAHHARIHN